MLLSANERAVSLSQLGTRDLNFKAREKLCKIILLISEILLLFLLFNSTEAKYYHNNANCIDFSERVNSIIITSQLWLISPISQKIQNFSGRRVHRKSPLLLSFLYLLLRDISRVTWETPSSEAVPSIRSRLGVRASYATRHKRRYEANKCG